jgi:hypothetical protein
MKELLKDNWTMLRETLVELCLLIIYIVIVVPFIIILLIPAVVLAYYRKFEEN